MKAPAILGTALAVGATVAMLSLTVASASSGPVVKTVGRDIATAPFGSNLRFVPHQVTVKHGETVTWVDADTTGDPHTVTVVKKADLPSRETILSWVKTGDFSGCTGCNIAAAANYPNGFTNPPVLDANAGPAGLDEVGDSLLFGPGTGRMQVSAVISAPAETRLFYMCAIHPWMQGTIDVE